MDRKNPTIFAVMVVYNKSCENSLTFKCLKNAKDIELIVCDNSTSDYGNEKLSERYGFTYINMGGNMGLPKAYNAAIDYIGRREGFICLLDDDTDIGKDYFKKLRKYIQKTDWEIFLPLVYDHTGLLSPCIMKSRTCKRATDPDEIDDRHLTAINSGMAISTEVFEDYRYDENMFLDYVDHAFMRDMLRVYRRVGIMKDIILNQTFAGNEMNKPAEIVRFKIFKKDLRYFYRDGFVSFLCYLNVIYRHRLRLCLKYNTPYFMFLK